MYMDSLSSNGNNFSYNIHVQSKIYWEFYHCIIYVVNEGLHIRVLHRSFEQSELILSAIE